MPHFGDIDGRNPANSCGMPHFRNPRFCRTKGLIFSPKLTVRIVKQSQKSNSGNSINWDDPPSSDTVLMVPTWFNSRLEQTNPVETTSMEYFH